jgi:hypothetical protein
VTKLVESQLEIVEEYLIQKEKIIRKNDTDTYTRIDKTFDVVKFLKELSGIECDKGQSFGVIYIPSRQNLNDLKEWYLKNKS